jgi:hypothetical protein
MVAAGGMGGLRPSCADVQGRRWYEIVQIGGERAFALSVTSVGGFRVPAALAFKRIPEPESKLRLLGAGRWLRADEGLRSRKWAAMDTEGEYRQRAATCLRLANESRDAYVKVALTELAIELSSMADSVETCGIDERRPKIS